MFYVKYTLKKFPFSESVFPFKSCSFLTFLYLIKTTDDDSSYRTVYKHGKMIARQRIYNGVSYERF